MYLAAITYLFNEQTIQKLFLALFGGMMGCAIGMSVAAACEIIYWLTFKPFVKWMMATKLREVSPKFKTLYKMSFIVVFLMCVGFWIYQFRFVYLTFQTRSRHE